MNDLYNIPHVWGGLYVVPHVKMACVAAHDCGDYPYVLHMFRIGYIGFPRREATKNAFRSLGSTNILH